MFKYDAFYDYLFENTEFLNILYKFHCSNWYSMTVDERKEVIDSFISKYFEILKIDNKISRQKDSSKSYSGYYSDYTCKINVNEDNIKTGNSYDILDTLFHELRHNFQHRAIVNNLSSLESVSETNVKKWEINFLVSPTGYSNYISNTGEDAELYIYQPVEEDAFKTGLCLTKKSYELIKEELGEDISFAKYAEVWKKVIMTFFSEEDIYVEHAQKQAKKVFEKFKSNNKAFKTEEKCLRIASDILDKDVKNLTELEIHALFSTYVWAHIDMKKQKEILEYYDSMTNDSKKVKIEKSGNSAFKIRKQIYVNNNILYILNELYSAQYSYMIDDILRGKKKCDENLKKELEVNLYQVDKKEINYIKDNENFITYSIQPYALYEGKIVCDKFRKVKQDIFDFYGIEDDKYNEMIDFYDYDKYIPFLEKFYDKPFKEIYDELVGEMEDRIKKIEANKR